MNELTTAIDNRTAIADIKRRYATGEIDRDIARALAEPILRRVNGRQQEIAKKHGRKNYPKLDFINAMR